MFVIRNEQDKVWFCVCVSTCENESVAGVLEQPGEVGDLRELQHALGAEVAVGVVPLGRVGVSHHHTDALATGQVHVTQPDALARHPLEVGEVVGDAVDLELVERYVGQGVPGEDAQTTA